MHPRSPLRLVSAAMAAALSLSALSAMCVPLFAQTTAAAPEDRAQAARERLREIVTTTHRTARPGEAARRFEEAGRQMLKEFPDQRSYGGSLLIRAAETRSKEEGDALLAEVIGGDFPELTKNIARGVQRRKSAFGKPLEMKFTALDGRAVDLAAMKGKVVLIDFWATWCGPCVAQLPGILDVYHQLHGQGFEVIGLSFDSDRAKLEEFIAKKKLPWPQHFDGKGWENEFGRHYGIRGIPVTWLVDKKGVLRQTPSHSDLLREVKSLLAEP